MHSSHDHAHECKEANEYVVVTRRNVMYALNNLLRLFQDQQIYALISIKSKPHLKMLIGP